MGGKGSALESAKVDEVEVVVGSRVVGGVLVRTLLVLASLRTYDVVFHGLVEEDLVG
jgi:hypothetical protein